MQKSLEDFAAAQAPLQALTLLNKTVEVREENGQALRGEVTAVRLQEGKPLLKVQGKEYPWQAVLQVEGLPAAGKESS